MSLSIGEAIGGFTVKETEELESMGGRAWLLQHQSGLTAIHLECDDPEKAFSINFKTPPSDDTGVFHILEHSVLCGSANYPVKEPFVHLKKTSMKTFLNALTSPEQTRFPVATTNEKDLINLVDVYMDAVLHPLLETNPDILAQEGWHYEVHDGQLSLGGVVYNEMKGALSKPVALLSRKLSALARPESSAVWCSGGHPGSIPSLTHEQFVDAWKRHYRLSNALVMTYGNMDIRALLTHLDQVHLQGVAAQHATRQGQSNSPGSNAFGNPAFEAIPMAISPDEQAVGMLFPLQVKPEEPWRFMAASVLNTALMGSMEAPLSRALIEQGICPIVLGDVDNSWLSPNWVVLGLTTQPHRIDEVKELVIGEAARYAAEGVPRQELDAAIDALEFHIKEATFGGTPKGLQYFSDLCQGWLSGGHWLGMTRYEEVVDFLRNPGSPTYYEELLQSMIVDNAHCVCAAVVAEEVDDPFGEKALLSKVSSQMSPEDLQRIEAEAQALKARRSQPDSPEAQAKLPRLSLSDIGEAPKRAQANHFTKEGVDCLRLDLDTRGISYAIWNYDAGSVSLDELQDLSMAVTLMNVLATENHTAQELQTAKSRLFADEFSIDLDFYNLDDDPDQVGVYLSIDAKMLDRNVPDGIALIHEILTTSRFDDIEKLVEIIQRAVMGLSNIIAQGDSSMLRHAVLSQFRGKSVLENQVEGLPFVSYVNELASHLGDESYLLELTQRFQQLVAKVIGQGVFLMSFAGNDESWDALVKAGGLLTSLASSEDAVWEGEPVRWVKPAPVSKLAVVYSGNVATTLQVDDLRQVGMHGNGSLNVVDGIITDEHLWGEVRVKGGAYGVGCAISHTGLLMLRSSRDPKPARTLEVFANLPQWLEEAQIPAQDIEGQIIGAVAAMDKPVTPMHQLDAANTRTLIHRSPEYRLKLRAEALATDASLLKDVAQACRSAREMGASSACAFVPVSMANALEGFEVIDPLGLLGQ